MSRFRTQVRCPTRSYPNDSKRTTILAGAGCAGAHQELIGLAGKLKAPIVHAMRGKEFIEYDVDHGFIGDTKTTIGALLNTQGEQEHRVHGRGASQLDCLVLPVLQIVAPVPMFGV